MYDLCLTSKSFNASFTPFLYAEVWIRSTNAQFLVENVQLLLGNSSLKCTKGLDVAIRPYSRLDTGHDEGTLSELYNKGVQALPDEHARIDSFYVCVATKFENTGFVNQR